MVETVTPPADSPRDRHGSRAATWRRGALIVVANFIVIGILVTLLEGAASLLFTVNQIVRTPGVPEHNHAEHDPLLGWINLPNVFLADFYGPGVHVQTNSQRFRNVQDFPAEVPAGRTRIICSGDSFTFGYGVGNDDVWCERLTALDPRLETVNMGLGGYGVDQAYLWYRRDAAPLDHNLHIFAFLTDDFNRMRSDRFMGYGKPFLQLDGDSLRVANLPVPRTSWIARQRALHGPTVARLNIVQLAERLLPTQGPEARAEQGARHDERLRPIVARIFEELRRANDAKGSRLVLVYFPGAWDYKPDPSTDAWRGFIADEAGRQGIAYFDLIEEIRRVPPAEVDTLYAPNRHFSVAGNAWAAETLDRLLAPLVDQQRARPDASVYSARPIDPRR